MIANALFLGAIGSALLAQTHATPVHYLAVWIAAALFSYIDAKT